jgi:hypothetical protein
MFKGHLIKRSLAGGLVIAAVGFPSAAQAMLYGGPSGASTPAATSAAPLTATAQGGFQWGDAGIGAGAAVVLLGVGALGTGATRRRRQPVIG